MAFIVLILKKIQPLLNLKPLVFQECISKNLKVMDMTAFTLCMENKLPIIVFDMNKPGNLLKVVEGLQVGTLVG
jgi:uridylate kinase